jgi:hypothetical protein
MTVKMSAAAVAFMLATACQPAGPSADVIAAEREAVAADAALKAGNAPSSEVTGSTAASAADAMPVTGDGAVTQSTAAQRPRPMLPDAGGMQPPSARRPDSGGVRIIGQTDRQGRIDPECVVTIRYQDGRSYDINVPYGSCADLNLRLIAVSELVEAGQLDDLLPSDRDDIVREAGTCFMPRVNLLRLRTRKAHREWPAKSHSRIDRELGATAGRWTMHSVDGDHGHLPGVARGALQIDIGGFPIIGVEHIPALRPE